MEEFLDLGNLVRLFRQEEAMDTVLKLLTESDYDVTKTRADGSSLLHNFSILGCYHIVKLLWERGARPTILKIDDSTILHSAVRRQDDAEADANRAQILTLFLTSGEDLENSMPINHQNVRGWTALKLAARQELEKCVEVLLKFGADPDIPDSEQYMASHNSINHPDILKLLLSKSQQIDAQNQEGETALYVACEQGVCDSAMILLEQGADPTIPNKEGELRVVSSPDVRVHRMEDVWGRV